QILDRKELSAARAHVDKRAQAVVLAEVAASVLVAGCAVRNITHGVKPDKAGRSAVAPQPQRLDTRPDRARFAAVLVHDNLRRLPGRAKTRTDEVDFGLHHRQIILRPSLKNESRAQRRQIWNRRHVEEYILRQYRRQPRHDLPGLPALPL